MSDTMTLTYTGMFPETTVIDSSNDKVVSGSGTGFRLFSWPEDSLKNGNSVIPTAGELVTTEAGSIFGICFSDKGDKIFGAIVVFDQSSPGGVARFDADTLKFEKAIRLPAGNVSSVYCDGSKIFALAHSVGKLYVCDYDLEKCDLIGESELYAPATFVGAQTLGKGDGVFVSGHWDKGIFIRTPINGDKVDGAITQVVVSGAPSSDYFVNTDDLIMYGDNTMIAITVNRVCLLTTTDDWKTATLEYTIDMSTSGSPCSGVKADGEHNAWITFGKIVPDLTNSNFA
jgi:hypothetical protein